MANKRFTIRDTNTGDVFETLYIDNLDGTYSQAVSDVGGGGGGGLVSYSEQDTYTTSGSGTTVNASLHPAAYYSIQVVGTAMAASAWVVYVEGSLDGLNWDMIIQHTNVINSDGTIVSSATPSIMRYIRTRCVSVTLGGATNIIANLVALQ